MFLTVVSISYFDERRVVGSGGGSEMGSSVFSRRMKYLDRHYLLVFLSQICQWGFQGSYSVSEPATEVPKVLREQCLPPCSEIEPSLPEWKLLLLSVFATLSLTSLKPDCCDSCTLPAPSAISSKDRKLSSSSPPPLLRLSLRSSPFEGARTVIQGL